MTVKKRRRAACNACNSRTCACTRESQFAVEGTYETKFFSAGRDFSGVIVDVGSQVKHLKIGDEVWGAIDAKRQGTHAEFCLASEKEISMKPKSVTHVEAAAMPFVAATTYSSLVSLGGLNERSTR